MKAEDIMTEACICCERKTTLEEVTQLMVEHNCGCIPVVNDPVQRRIVGIITDRDIICRVISTGKDPRTEEVGDSMSERVTTVTPSTSIGDCCQLMERNKVRRLPVVDKDGRCCGIVSQADIARHTSLDEAPGILHKLSHKFGSALRRAP